MPLSPENLKPKLKPEDLEDFIERRALSLWERYMELFKALSSPLAFLTSWVLLSFPPLWILLPGIFYKLSENLLEMLANGEELRPRLSFEDLLEALGYSLLLLPIILFWCSPTWLTLLSFYLLLRSSGGYLKGVIIWVLLGTFLLPLILAIQVVGLLGMPISILRFLEERDYRYALSLSEVTSDIEQMKADFWDIFLTSLGDFLLLSLIVFPVSLFFWWLFPTFLALIFAYLLFSAVLTLISLKSVMSFAFRYARNFLRL